ncbi:MAG: 2-oxo acid dehydrogenase subunit E2, partial [Actinobacteria bacterium]|nr:2-oxo acid dehydrogenase subunit E2 [Actinomycetota bacterium]
VVERVRAGTFSTDDVSGSTFTVTSLGGQGIDAFTPIINPPEAAILGVGRIVDQPARDGDGIAWRKVITLSLTIDHQVVDGAPGAAFLETVVALLADPQTIAQ